MGTTMILHHYENSPYAEKIRLMFGLSNTAWLSLLSPVWPPRPNVDPLTGGYRRIPVAQLGADIICDTCLISKEVALLTGNADLSPDNMSAPAQALMQQAETKVFFAAVAAVPQLRLVGTMLKEFGLVGTYKFAKDRTGMLKGGTTRPPSPEKAKKLIADLLADLEIHLEKNTWLNGDKASVADFAVYHPLWLHLHAARTELVAGPNTTRWYKAVTALGQGQRKEITQADAFAAARDNVPRPLPQEAKDNDLELGQVVSVSPSDYGLVPITGRLVMVTDDRMIIARDTEQFGIVHVHFPREGYSLTQA